MNEDWLTVHDIASVPGGCWWLVARGATAAPKRTLVIVHTVG